MLTLLVGFFRMGFKGGYWSPSWNDTIPTPHGTASNHIFVTDDAARLRVDISNVWLDSVALDQVVEAQHDSTSCLSNFLLSA